ncbi:MAG: hypothetical protein ACI9KE_003486 [Polyangiales bacterium]|jgi:hypothetical protein
MDFFEEMFGNSFMPHGHCYLWTPGILWGHVIADLTIALAYFSIPIVLIVLVRRRKDLAFGWIFLLFAVFILACGTGHVIDVWNVWNGDYGISALVRMLTALASIATAVALWPLLPKALAIPSPERLRTEVHERLRAEEGLLTAHGELEERVKKRTQELQDFSHLALDREDQMILLKQRVNELSRELGRSPEHDLSFLDESPEPTE